MAPAKKTSKSKKTAAAKKKSVGRAGAKKKKTSKTTKKAATKEKSTKTATKKSPSKKKVAKKKSVAKKVTKKAAKKTAKTAKTAKTKTAKKATGKTTRTKSTKSSRSTASAPARFPRYGATTPDGVGLSTRPEDQPPPPPLEKRIAKRDRDAIRKRLLEQRRQLLGSIDSIEAEYLGTNENQTTKGGDEADQASTALTADLSLRLAESESKVLQDVNHALSKLDDGTYGICEVTGEPIDVRRLLAMPWARLSLPAQQQVEQQQISFDEARGWVSADEF